jgi:hypothetical protein
VLVLLVLASSSIACRTSALMDGSLCYTRSHQLWELVYRLLRCSISGWLLSGREHRLSSPIKLSSVSTEILIFEPSRVSIRWWMALLRAAQRLQLSEGVSGDGSSERKMSSGETASSSRRMATESSQAGHTRFDWRVVRRLSRSDQCMVADMVPCGTTCLAWMTHARCLMAGPT